MMNLKQVWHQAVDKQAWSARRTALMAKLGATKAVWFPPDPTSTAKKAASKGRKTTKKTAKKTARSATKAKQSAGNSSR